MSIKFNLGVSGRVGGWAGEGSGEPFGKSILRIICKSVKTGCHVCLC